MTKKEILFMEIKKWVNEHYPNGYDIYADYNDALNEKSLKQIFESNVPKETFEDLIWENYCDYSGQIEREEWENLKEYLEFNNMFFPETDEDMLIEEFRDHFYVNIPFDHYLNQSLCFNFILDVGDWNSDLYVNNVYPHYSASAPFRLNDLSNESVITWLIQQQGYSKKQMSKYFKKKMIDPKTFLGSLYQELENCTTSMNALTFLKKMTLKEYFDLVEDGDFEKVINIPVKTTGGLYDQWNGAGSLLEIVLEKELNIPIKLLKIIPDETIRYSVHEVYGVTDQLWE